MQSHSGHPPHHEASPGDASAAHGFGQPGAMAPAQPGLAFPEAEAQAAAGQPPAAAFQPSAMPPLPGAHDQAAAFAPPQQPLQQQGPAAYPPQPGQFQQQAPQPAFDPRAQHAGAQHGMQQHHGMPAQPGMATSQGAPAQPGMAPHPGMAPQPGMPGMPPLAQQQPQHFQQQGGQAPGAPSPMGGMPALPQVGNTGGGSAAGGTGTTAAEQGQHDGMQPAMLSPTMPQQAPATGDGDGGTGGPGALRRPPGAHPHGGLSPAGSSMGSRPGGPPPLGSGPAGAGSGRPGGMQFKGVTAMQLQGKRLRIGEVLIDMGIIEQGQLDRALTIQKETGQRLGKVLISEGLVSSTDIARALARRMNIDFVDLGEIDIRPEVMAAVPYELCRRYEMVPIDVQGNTLIVAMADPTNVFALDDLKMYTGRDVRVVVAVPESVDLVQSRLFSLDDAVAVMADSAEDYGDDHVPLEDIKDSTSDAPAINLVNQIIAKAVTEGVSDLHFEPQADDMVVRFRKDGVLAHVTTVPNKLRGGVTSRLKIMASLDISERRKPQDGRVGLLVGDKPIDLRMATLPTVYGEKAVLRVLDKSNVMLTMDQLGFLPAQLDKLRHCYTQPYGCLLVTGPTGSGKSTTLYGALNEVNDIEKNIITVEDPVEYRLRGINQVQVNTKAGLSFAAALRSILRCDPDIVMIGEMRDHETASIGIEAALTGHLVLSTLHTNTAPGALTRLTEMDIEPYLVSSSVLGVLAQRLARRLCKCAESYEPTRDELVAEGFTPEIVERPGVVLRRPVGCHRCGGKGYKGRTGLHEVMMMSEEIAQLSIARATAEDMEKVAIEQGMITLWMDGMEKVLLGQTTMDELRRVVQH